MVTDDEIILISIKIPRMDRIRERAEDLKIFMKEIRIDPLSVSALLGFPVAHQTLKQDDSSGTATQSNGKISRPQRLSQSHGLFCSYSSVYSALSIVEFNPEIERKWRLSISFIQADSLREETFTDLSTPTT